MKRKCRVNMNLYIHSLVMKKNSHNRNKGMKMLIKIIPSGKSNNNT